METWSWPYNIKHTAPPAEFSFKSYETHYNSKGYYCHKINVLCKNMQGEKLYCKVYDSAGNLRYDWGSDAIVRKTKNEVGFFSWNGYTDGVKNPPGEYTFIITSSANKKVLEVTDYLKILERPKG